MKKMVREFEELWCETEFGEADLNIRNAVAQKLYTLYSQPVIELNLDSSVAGKSRIDLQPIHSQSISCQSY